MKPTPDFTTLFNVLSPGGAACPVRLLGIRGALEASGAANDCAIYDDLIVVNIAGRVSSYRASTDPSHALVANPINPEGAAQLRPGLWWMEKHFLHGDPSKKCLGQSRDVSINRLDAAGNPTHTEFGQFGICIHSGGSGMGTGRFSAGCQIVRNDDGYFGEPTWSDFILPIREAMDRYSLREIPYLLIEDTGYEAPHNA
jgi:hypothetical protein